MSLLKVKSELESKEEMKELLKILRSPGFTFKFENDFFEDELEKEIANSMIQESILDFLEEELEQKISENWEIHYEFQCPHCAYKSRLFYRICLHIASNKKCNSSDKISPCYPINKCYIVENGTKRSVIP